MVDAQDGAKPERKLRSKIDEAAGCTKNLFRFNPDVLLASRKLRVKNDCRPISSPEAFLAGPKFTINLVKHEPPPLVRKRRRTDPGDDRVPDELYLLYHTRMLRREKQFSNLDKDKMLNELDNYQQQLEKLCQADWFKHLPYITHVDNPNDYTELATKRRLTIREIESLITKYQAWKQTSDQLLARLKRLPIDDPDATDEDENTLPLLELQKRWIARRTRLKGPVINLKVDYCTRLVIDPVYPPTFVYSKYKACTYNEPASLQYKRFMDAEEEQAVNERVYRFDQSREVAKDSQFSNVGFGCELPRCIHQPEEFELPFEGGSAAGGQNSDSGSE
ncbi:hypothetical protein BABINDRAFT_161086 [Babjeviella inositovora NRRL Y-12698]|uniref:Something about silencing protein 4 domain-containing protein n=1 Tax=Babjeviella inositovora NRRL Y-12698 TaxID=984486 RepID=A0A1E3QQW8_9ASCO|nr:uncharacterized protein BABINDRAFT_161086 [Babjeviella inositovora NRRL Y-12698]ODQ80093.1 hypothetical protein BABINDRAFT_161086 [Babjeviella inositovora NRRL Y-12698]